MNKADYITSASRLEADASHLRGRMRALEDIGRGRVELRHTTEWHMLRDAAEAIEKEASSMRDHATTM